MTEFNTNAFELALASFHTYHSKTAEEVYGAAVAFYQDAMELLHQLQKR